MRKYKSIYVLETDERIIKNLLSTKSNVTKQYELIISLKYHIKYNNFAEQSTLSLYIVLQ